MLGHHQQLLVILLAEHGEVGPALNEELGHDGGHAVKEVRAELVLEIGLGRAFQDHGGGEIRAIDFLRRRGENQMGAGLGQLGHIARLVAGIAAQILIRAELLGIHENRHEHLVGPFQAFGHQREWPSWRAPMVGTMAKVRSSLRHLAVSRRSPSMERTIFGFTGFDPWVWESAATGTHRKGFISTYFAVNGEKNVWDCGIVPPFRRPS